jgi:oligopeptide transport system ATP-binding protein
MYLGKIVELTDRATLYQNPMHPYTQALLSAVPIPDPVAEAEREKRRVILQGDVPSPARPPKGCNFCTRCPLKERARQEKGIDCDIIEPEFKETQSDHWVACHLY